MEKYKLEEFNPWWINKRVEEDLALPFKRPTYFELESSLKKRFILVETAVINKLKATFFWKNSHEIDVISNNIPTEVKYQERINSNDLKPIKLFMKKFNN